MHDSEAAPKSLDRDDPSGGWVPGEGSRIRAAYRRIASIVAETEETGGWEAFGALFELTSDALVVLDGTGRPLRVNPSGRRLLRVLPDMAQDGSEWLLAGEDRELLRELLAQVRRSGRCDLPAAVTALLEGAHPDSRARRLRWQGVHAEGRFLLIGQQTAGGFSEPDDLEGDVVGEVARSAPNRLDVESALARLGAGLGWEAAAIWLPSEDDSYLQCAGYWGRGGLTTGDFAMATREIRFERGLGLIGRVWESRREEWLNDVTELSDYVRIGPARREGLRSAFVLPLEGGEGCVGVLEFYSRRERSPREAQIDRTRRIAEQMGRALAGSGSKDPG